MRKLDVYDLVQLVTGVAVVIGLGLVIWELQQSKALARAQLASDGYSEKWANRRARIGENPMPAIVKACVSPRDLTDVERAVALENLDLIYDQIARFKRLSEVGDFDIPWQEYAIGRLKTFLGTPIGRYDYEMYRDTRWDPQILEIADRIVENNEQIDCQSFWQGFEEWLRRNDA